MSKKDKILIVITIILVAVLIGGFVWDYNGFLLKRTLKIEITDDMDVISMNKAGTLFYRKAYEARIKLPREKAEDELNLIIQTYGADPEIMSDVDFAHFADESFKSELLKPQPVSGTEVAVVKATDGDDLVTFMMDVENESDAFIYVYYYRG